MKVQIKILNKEFYTEDNLPQYATSGSAAIDLVCTEDVIINPQGRAKIHTGLAIWSGCNKHVSAVLNSESVSGMSIAALILPRSGLGSKGLALANTIGLIDSDYQGELIVNVWNNTVEDEDQHKYFDVVRKTIILEKGQRFAQLLFIPVIKTQWDVVKEFSNTTDRGTGGFGSTGG